MLFISPLHSPLPLRSLLLQNSIVKMQKQDQVPRQHHCTYISPSGNRSALHLAIVATGTSLSQDAEEHNHEINYAMLRPGIVDGERKKLSVVGVVLFVLLFVL